MNNPQATIDQSGDHQIAVSEAHTKSSTRKRSKSSAKPPAPAVKQVQKGLKKFITVLESAKKKDINESDTSNIVNDILGDVLGYDKFFDVTTEYKIRGQYADYGIRIKDKIHAFIEVKAINIALNQNHLFQVASYAVHEGVDWAILTNGNVWQLYRVEDSKPVTLSLVLSIDLFDPDVRYAAKCEAFAVFHKKSLLSGYIDKLWKEKSCVNPDAIKKLIRSKEGVTFLRKGLKKQTGYRIEDGRILDMLSQVIGD